MKIRPMQRSDQDEWLRMRLSLWPHHSEQELLSEMTSILADASNLVAFALCRPGGGLGGFVEVSLRVTAHGCRTSPVGYVEGWYVDADLRRQGLGRQLLRAAEDWAKEKGCAEMASDCLLDNEVSARAHLANGYEETDRLILFRKRL